jgi:hypothetical protein
VPVARAAKYQPGTSIHIAQIRHAKNDAMTQGPVDGDLTACPRCR